MSSSNINGEPEQLCYISCSFCNIVLGVNVPCCNLGDIMTIRCGHCSNLSSVNMRASFESISTKDVHQVPCRPETNIVPSSSTNKELSKQALLVNPPREKVVNRPPEKRHRAPSLYNQFIKEEIQRIKVNNPNINHREAFSTAAKNWARFPHIHFGLMLERSEEAKLIDGSEDHFQRLQN